MPATLNSALTNYGNDSYYSEDFLIAVQSYIPLLRNSLKINYITPSNTELFKYVGDFFGLLDTLGYDKQYHFAIMLFNNLRCTGDFNTDLSVIAIPDLIEIDLLNSTYSTINSN